MQFPAQQSPALPLSFRAKSRNLSDFDVSTNPGVRQGPGEVRVGAVRDRPSGVCAGGRGQDFLD